MDKGSISLRDVTITVGRRQARAQQTTLLNNVTMTLQPGTRTALIGKSGSGKSLLAAALTGRLPHTVELSGTVHAPEHTALIHQDSMDALNPIVRIGRQLAIAEPHRKRVLSVVSSLGFDDPEDILRRFPAELSGGQRQRIAIALGLLRGTDLLVADESTTALDPVNQQSVLSALGSIEHTTVLFITHDLALAAACCEYIYVMDAGRIVEMGTLDAVIKKPTSSVTRALVEQALSRQEVAV